MNPSSNIIVSRRRCLTILAGAVVAATSGHVPAVAAARIFEWRGTALGAKACLIFVHEDKEMVQTALCRCLAEIERLEALFSLYRGDSEINRLNRDGVLLHPSLEMISLLRLAQAVGEASGGAFDVSVQPLWHLYADHFRRHPGDCTGPPPSAIRTVVQRIDFRRIEVRPGCIRLVPRMALTLNGIAQGYITDRVAELLRGFGWSDVLINLGELRGMGGPGPDQVWTALLDTPPATGGALASIPISGRAMATSCGRTTAFEASGQNHHLFSPREGQSAGCWYSVSVAAPHAALADALSTALYVTPRADMGRLLQSFPSTEAWLVAADGGIEHLAAASSPERVVSPAS